MISHSLKLRCARRPGRPLWFLLPRDLRIWGPCGSPLVTKKTNVLWVQSVPRPRDKFNMKWYVFFFEIGYTLIYFVHLCTVHLCTSLYLLWVLYSQTMTATVGFQRSEISWNINLKCLKWPHLTAGKVNTSFPRFRMFLSKVGPNHWRPFGAKLCRWALS